MKKEKTRNNFYIWSICWWNCRCQWNRVFANCSFNGTIKVVKDNRHKYFYAGGIAGYNEFNYLLGKAIETIDNHKVLVYIESVGFAGGIVGYSHREGGVKNSSFQELYRDNIMGQWLDM